MKHLLLALVVTLFTRLPAVAQSAWSPGEETLTYTINWPSGLSLGEAKIETARMPAQPDSPARWELRLTLDAAIPGFTVADRFRSITTPDLCSIEFERDTTHGKRIGEERTTFDPAVGSASRQTLVPQGGGKSQLSTPACAKDALAFLFYVRSELAQGRLPAPQTVFYGGPYQVRLEYGGRQKLLVGDDQVEADRLTASVGGAASDTTFEIFFAQDRTRRPVLVRVPLSMGNFTMELEP
jgi:hypothetical protein